MPSCPRKDVIRPGEIGIFHRQNRCVRRAFLCGEDSVTGKSYQHRRDWIREIQRKLAGLFAVEICFHAEMSNHIHVILRSRPDVVDEWSDQEVVRRWMTISRLVWDLDDTGIEKPTENEVAVQLAKPGRVAQIRLWLSDISKFMGAMCEHVSRRCNAEDGVTGHFWEDRFKCKSLEDESAILVCGIYVDLNQIHAGETLTPETSSHTSAYDRIQGRQAQLVADGSVSNAHESERSPDDWLCELTIDLDADMGSCVGHGPRASNKGLLSVSRDEYFRLLDWTGRELRSDKKGTISTELAPILERLAINPQQWLAAIEHFDDWFGAFVGHVAKLLEAAARIGRKWLRGTAHCAAVFV